MKNKIQIIPYIILNVLLVVFIYSFTFFEKKDLYNPINIEITPIIISAEDDEAVCGLKEIVCPFEVKKTYTAWATKFSRADSCHNRKGDKCLTAIGQDTQEGITVACPRWLKLGSKVRILGHIYTCHDRYAQWVQNRQGDTFDIFTENYNEAKNFGKQRLMIEIL